MSDDGGLTFGATDSFTWNISATNILPQFDQNLLDRTSAETRRVSLSASASDLDGDPLTYTATGLPTGLTINASTGLISGRIDDNAATNSPFTVQLRVSDNGGTTTGDIDNFTWTVTSNDDPTFDTTLVDRNDPEGTVISMSASATDPNNDTLLYGATGLPAGISIDTETGLISGTISYLASPDSPYAVTVTVSDDNGNTENATQSFTWVVTNANQAPVFDFDIVDRADDQNDVISMQLSATDVDGETLTYGAFGLPPGLHVNSTEGVVFGTIAPTPPPAVRTPSSCGSAMTAARRSAPATSSTGRCGRTSCRRSTVRWATSPGTRAKWCPCRLRPATSTTTR